MPGGALEQEQQGPSSVFVGQKLDEHRGAFILDYPMDKGHITDGGWDAMERIWEVSVWYSLINYHMETVVAFDALFLQALILILLISFNMTTSNNSTSLLSQI